MAAAEGVGSVVDAPPLPLESEWTWHAHADLRGDYGSAVVALGSFGTVQDFWRYYNHIPTPDAILCGTGVLRLPKAADGGCTVNGLALFRRGVQPAWEDPRNAGGCDLCARQTFAPERLKALWRELLVSLINEELGANVVGARLTAKRDRRTGAVCHKVEVWCDDLETRLVRARLATIVPGAALETVSHRDVASAQQSRHAGAGRRAPRRPAAH